MVSRWSVEGCAALSMDHYRESAQHCLQHLSLPRSPCKCVPDECCARWSSEEQSCNSPKVQLVANAWQQANTYSCLPVFAAHAPGPVVSCLLVLCWPIRSPSSSHQQSAAASASSASAQGSSTSKKAEGVNSEGLPFRPGVQDCAHYLRHGWCRFKQDCWYHHPESRQAVGVAGNTQPSSI